ncbi:MAG: hypothetical protein ABIK75_05605 [candidate division WOR-3 bacterium]
MKLLLILCLMTQMTKTKKLAHTWNVDSLFVSKLLYVKDNAYLHDLIGGTFESRTKLFLPLVLPCASSIHLDTVVIFSKGPGKSQPFKAWEGTLVYNISSGRLAYRGGTKWDTVATLRDIGAGVGGSGSPTQIAFWTSSNTIGGNNNLWWDNTNNRLGIGTSSPAYRLDVNGSSRIQGDLFINSWAIRVRDEPYAGYVLKWEPEIRAFMPLPDEGVRGNGNEGQVAFWTSPDAIGGDNNLYWDNTNKRLGIGALPDKKLVIYAGMSDDLIKLASPSGAYNWSGIRFQGLAPGGWSLAAIRGIDVGAYNGDLAFYTDGDGIENENLVERMRIRYTGNVGIGTSDPKSRLHVAGSISLPVRTVSVNYTATDSDYMILVDASGGARTITLPVVAGRVYIVKKIDTSGNDVYVVPASGTIDGASNFRLSSQWKCVSVISDGTNYYIISSY